MISFRHSTSALLPLGLLGTGLLSAATCQGPQDETEGDQSSIEVRFEPWGPDEAELDEVAGRLLEHPSLKKRFQTNHRLLSIRPSDPYKGEDGVLVPPDRFHATYYDYTNNVPFEVTGRIKNLENIEVRELDYQPLPSQQERDAAMDIVMQADGLAAAIGKGKVRIYTPMPPVIRSKSGERIITFGIHSELSSIRPEMMGVNVSTGQLVRNLDIIDPSLLRLHPCYVPGYTTCPPNGKAGAYKVTIWRFGQVVWSFVAVRPAASSGALKNSGIELLNVRYKGKLVLFRAHAPILNVVYQDHKCPSYRDWLGEETCFQADGQDVAPGFREGVSRPETIFDHYDDDTGSFRGVAVYTHRDTVALIQGDEVFLVSELEAGWYRYLSQWSFLMDGTIRPRFGFAAVENYCTCFEHTHHVYWRFDFDVHTHGANTVEELVKIGTNWHTLRTITAEKKLWRDGNLTQKWRVTNNAGRYFEIIPGHHDGSALGDSFAKGDLWILRYRTAEDYDAVKCVAGCDVTVQLDGLFIDGEDVAGEDVVVWYRASYDHDAADHGDLGAHEEIVGPDLLPSQNYTN